MPVLQQWGRIALCVFLLTSVLAPGALAQRSDVQKLLDEAARLRAQRRNLEAMGAYQEVLNQDPGNYEAVVQMGYLLEQQESIEEAVKWYQTALDLDPRRNDTLFIYLGMAQKQLGRYDESTLTFERFLTVHQRNDYLVRTAKRQIEGNRLAQQLATQPEEWAYTDLRINSEASDYDPVIFRDGDNTFLIFASHRKEATGEEGDEVFGEPKRSDLFATQIRDDSTFGRVENLGRAINSIASDGSPCITPDGLTMYYTICGGGRLGKQDGCSIYQSTYDPDTKEWSQPEPVEGINGTREVVVNNRGKTERIPTYDTHPSLTPDGNIMYFVSDRDGGMGQTDIWFSRRTGNSWSEPQNCGNVINTEFHENQPNIGPDGQTLYFASDGHPSLGGYDIFYSTGRESNWNSPRNMGKLNSSWDDFTVQWLEQDSVGYLVTNRPGGRGRDDIYLIQRIVPEVIELAVQGFVRDDNTRQVIPASDVELAIISGETVTVLDTFNTEADGQYRFDLEKGNRYRLVAVAPEYLTGEEFVATIDATKIKELDRDVDIFLERVEIVKPIVLQNIYYDYDKAELRPESVQELDRLIALMRDNPGISIQIGSHTDTNASEAYNDGLSERRAASVVNYLLANDIPPTRITSRGYGESQPLIYPELSDEDEQANRRSEFRIIALDPETPDRGDDD